MNGSAEELQRRRLSNKQLDALVADFRRAEEPIVQLGSELFGIFLRDALPRLQGYALESGDYVGKLNCEVTIDLSTGKKSIKITGVATPPPWKIQHEVPITY